MLFSVEIRKHQNLPLKMNKRYVSRKDNKIGLSIKIDHDNQTLLSKDYTDFST